MKKFTKAEFIALKNLLFIAKKIFLLIPFLIEITLNKTHKSVSFK